MSERRAPWFEAPRQERYSDAFWRLTDLGRCVVLHLALAGEPLQEGEIRSGIGHYHRSLAQTLRSLIRRGVVERVGFWEYTLTDAGLVMLGRTPRRPQLRVIAGGAAHSQVQAV